MNQASKLESDDSQETLGFIKRLKIPALIIVVLMYLLVVVFYFVGINAKYNSTNLILGLNIIFVVIPSLIIAFIAARSFLRTGNWAVMWMGMGTLSFGLAVFLSYLIGFWAPINASSTNFPIIILFAGLSYFFAALFLFSRTPHYEERRGRQIILLIGNIGVIAFATIFTLISVQGILPPFFIQGHGSTALREIILVVDAVLFLISGIIILEQYLKVKSVLLYWFSLSLFLIFRVLVGNLLVVSAGSPLSWTLRITQLLGGIYLFITALVILKEAKIQQKSADEILAGFFNGQKSNLEELLRNVKDAIIITDPQFYITGWNTAAESIYGWKSEEALGKPAMEFLQTQYKMGVVPSDMLNYIGTNDGWSDEVIQKHKNGQDIDIITSISPLKAKTDIITGLIAINKDISRQKQAEKALKEAKGSLESKVEERTIELNNERQRLFDVFETIPIMICLLTEDYHVDFANKAFRDRFGESGGRHCYEYCFGLNEPCDFCESYKVFETGKPHKWEVKTPDGSVIEAYDFPFEDMDGTKLILEMDIDITEERKAAETLKNVNEILEQRVAERTSSLQQSQDHLRELIKKLEVSNRELEQFAYVASHDLQEPLRMVNSFTQLLEMRYKEKLDDDADEFIGFIVEGANRMKDLIDDLLAFSRLNTEAKPFEDIKMEETVNAVISYLKPSIKENNAEITYEKLPNISGDNSQIRQLFQNLISNAIKFQGNQSPKVHISAQESKNEWKFGVTDNGIGIDPEHQEQIFSIFKRLYTREEYEGTGIGLAICKRIVERHGGQIWVESEEGKGSTFYFTIPK